MKTLVRATNWVGDVILSLPAVRALRAGLRRDELCVLARPWVADLYRLLPEVDRVLVEDPKTGPEEVARKLAQQRFDRAVLLPNSFGTAWTVFRAGIPERIGYPAELRAPLLTRRVRPAPRPGEHQVWKHLRVAEAAGAPAVSAPDVSWPVGEAQRQAARKLLGDAGWDGRPFAAAHVASFAHAAKRWPLPRYARVFERLAEEQGFTVVLLGSAGERAVNGEAAALGPAARVLDLSGRSTLAEVLGILSMAALFVGNDSGIAHLANAAGAPTVVVFGSTDPDATRPWDGPRGDGKPARLALVRRRPLCAPCRFDVCPLDHRCMTDVSVEDVLSAARSLLK